MNQHPLAAVLLAHLPSSIPPGDPAEVETVLADFLGRARTAWPKVTIAPEHFFPALATKLPAAEDAIQALRQVNLVDLCLAHACGSGDPLALDAFEVAVGREIDGALRRMSLAEELIDDVKQELRWKLFVGSAESQPKIADYSGRADLRTWVRTVAIRSALNLLRKRQEVPVEDEILQDLPDLRDNPELDHFKQRYRDEFRAAFCEALAMLTVRQRNVLRHHHVDGLSIDEIGALYGVHRTTAFRWLERARQALGDRIQQAFKQRVKCSTSEMRSIMTALRSHIELSMERMLK